uniref:Uncharacterized protein n=1 Tax=Anguilla anguilla TaxID=7936 RepID=A0A0E9X5S8_ANGAN
MCAVHHKGADYDKRKCLMTDHHDKQETTWKAFEQKYFTGFIYSMVYTNHLRWN